MLMFRQTSAALLLVLAGTMIKLPAPAMAQPIFQPPPAELSPEVRLEQASNATRTHLERVEAFISGGQWEEAIDSLLSVVESDGDQMIAAHGEEAPDALFARYVTVRRYCQMQIANYAGKAPAALELYRRRVDPLAERWFTEALAERDESLLRRLVEQMFCSSFGDDALLHLGEWCLRQGQYTDARYFLESLHPALRAPSAAQPIFQVEPGAPLWLAIRNLPLDEYWDELQPVLHNAAKPVDALVYPDTTIDLAEIRARLVLVSILEGSLERARIELALLGRLHPEAEGEWGGRRQKYVTRLEEMLEHSDGSPAARAAGDWTTFAADPARNTYRESVVDTGGLPIWRVPLPETRGKADLLAEDRERVAETAEELLSYHPVAVDGRVLVNTPDSIRAYDLLSGKPAFDGSSAVGAIYNDHRNPGLPSSGYVGVPRYTLTAHGDKLFARIGSPVTGTRGGVDLLSNEQGSIVGLDLAAQGKMLPGFPLRPEGGEWAFEGSPLTDGVHLFVAMRKHEQVLAQSYVAAFDIQTGEMLWRTMVAAADTPAHGQYHELTHHLLTLANDTLYFNTNLGAVAAIDPHDGQRRWIMRYPRSPYRSADPERTDYQFFRDLTPCLAVKDLVVAAPADCDRIFALDSQTGRLLWSTDGERGRDIVHLLGAGQDRLVASGDYLYWFDIYSGQSVGQFPGARPNLLGHQRPLPRGFGRGLLAEDYVYWPTYDALYLFRQQTADLGGGFWQPVHVGLIPWSTRGASGGNLVLAGQTLLIATANELIALGYGPPLLPQPR